MRRLLMVWFAIALAGLVYRTALASLDEGVLAASARLGPGSSIDGLFSKARA